MSQSKNKGKQPPESNKKQSSELANLSSNYSGSRRRKCGRNNKSLSFIEELTSTSTEISETSSSEQKQNDISSSLTQEASSFSRGASSFTVGVSSVYSDPSKKRRNKKQLNSSSSTQGTASFSYADSSDFGSDERKQYRKPKSFMRREISSAYAANVPGASFQTTGTFNSDLLSDTLSSDQSTATTSSRVSRQSEPLQKIQLMPFRVKDVMKMIKDNPAYRDKSPVMIKVKENDIDQLLEGKQVIRGKAQPLDKYFPTVLRDSPISVQAGLKNGGESFRMSTGAESGRSRTSKESERSYRPPDGKQAFAGADQTQKVFALPDIQAFPVVQTVPRRRVTSRSRSRRLMSPTPRLGVSRTRSRRHRSRPVRRVVRRRSPVRRVIRRPPCRRRYISPCTAFPMCDDGCPGPYRTRPYFTPPRRVVSSYSRGIFPQRVVSHAYNTPYTASSRGLYYNDIVTSRPVLSQRQLVHRGNCCCNVCEEKLQFIQPGLCTKRKNVWTNEYAVIPKPQVHLIDPCEELDPAIYPRADNPCIRDGQGNPLTDCIGRPLRSPIGKRFLGFTANGSVMETNIRGNFWTGQPPLCVKCPMPTNSCGQDTTHNWWMSCGYPIMPDMNPFYKRVLAAEKGPC